MARARIDHGVRPGCAPAPVPADQQHVTPDYAAGPGDGAADHRSQESHSTRAQEAVAGADDPEHTDVSADDGARMTQERREWADGFAASNGGNGPADGGGPTLMERRPRGPA